MVSIELPEDIAAEEVEIDAIPAPLSKLRRPHVDEKMIERLVTALSRAERPMILVGA